ncbi:L,D-transpeptidase [Streptacidiphilus cavernicola]|uniref:L,D-transpeptidase n=1 Tax=Streptacidiphilus cavernicola TaxID=3342716 RepID=A0ABV6VTV6_9ACTN
MNLTRKRAGVLLAAAGIVATTCAGVSDAQAQPLTALAVTATTTTNSAATRTTTATAPTAVRMVRTVAKKATGPNAAGLCPVNKGRIACVDLTHQRMWVQVGTKVVFGPVQVRTGRRGYVTRTGLWHVYSRQLHHWSTLYNVAMPYSEFFSGGEAFHGLNEPMSTPPGSHGCVNMNTWDAKKLWGVLKLHDPVQVFGRKPGT